MIDWTSVIDVAIPTIPATLAVLITWHNKQQMKTPSGDSIGKVVERTHDLAAVATLANVRNVEQQPGMGSVERRLNADLDSPVTVNGLKEQK